MPGSVQFYDDEGPLNVVGSLPDGQASVMTDIPAGATRVVVTAQKPPDPVPARPAVTMGHLDAIGGALAGAVAALERGAVTREWDSLQAATGEAWADIQRAAGYALTLKSRVPAGPGFESCAADEG